MIGFGVAASFELGLNLAAVGAYGTDGLRNIYGPITSSKISHFCGSSVSDIRAPEREAERARGSSCRVPLERLSGSY
jgi:hypothetical protein